MSWGGAPPPYQQQNQRPPGQYGYQAPPQQGGYRPPPTQGGYAPPPQQGGYRPPPTQGGYRPPPTQGGYNAQAPPPAQAPGYGAPPPQTGYQAPHGAPAGAGYPGGAPHGGGYRAGAPQGGGYPGGAPHAGYAPPQAPPPGISPDLWGWFQSVDTDRSGKITSQELQQALHNGNWTPFNTETCRLMIGMFDRDRSGTIDIQEFSALWKYIQDWKACFDRFDTDRSGNINSSELNNAFINFGYNLSMNFVTICMKTYDRHGRGSINFDDFIQCCVMLKSLTDKFREKDTNQNGQIRVHYEDFLKMVLENS